MPTNSMKMLQSTSSQIASYGHDAATQTLRVQFRSGDTYEYSEVSEDKFNEMQAADSHGKFLATRIKPYHDHKKVTAAGDNNKLASYQGEV